MSARLACHRLLLASAAVAAAAAVALLPGSAVAQKVFFNPFSGTHSVPNGGTANTYALDNATRAVAKVETAGISTQLQVGPLSATVGSSAAVDAANAWNADIFVMVASNAGGGHGCQTFHYSNSTPGQALATHLYDAMRAAYPIGAYDRGIAPNDTWDVLKRTTMPAVVAEVLFHDCTTAHTTPLGSVSESAFLIDSAGRGLIATGIANGICSHFGTSCPTTCTPGGSCSTGLPGVCSQGTWICQGTARVCDPNTDPSPEQCDNLDNDCDGATDENDPGGGPSCSTGLPGVCGPGTVHCQQGSLTWVPNASSSNEICDNKDNDCDGATDEDVPGVGASCNTGLLGVCSAGTARCQGGAITCVPNASPSNEICDNKDNDCDGSTDEGNPGGGGSCGTGLPGVCNAGTLQCQGGTVTCVQNVQASAEVCDTLDNDCDGSTDENDPGGGGACPVPGKQGVCALGILHCQTGSLICVQVNTPTAEICDGLDNDCDGIPDNPPVCAGRDAGQLPGPDASAPPGPDAAAPPGPDAAAPPGPDAGGVQPGMDASSPLPGEDAAVDEPGEDASAAEETDGGGLIPPDRKDASHASHPDLPPGAGACGCNAGAGASGLAGLWALGVAILGARRRRR